MDESIKEKYKRLDSNNLRIVDELNILPIHGWLFLSFRDTAPSSPTQGNWVAWVGTYDDIASTNPGEFRIRIKDNKHEWDCCYPGVEILPNGEIVTTTYGHWDKGKSPYILSVRINIKDLN